jgi:hypothetical protein
MRVLTLGFAGIIVISTVLGLLWVTEVMPSDRLATVASFAYGSVLVLMLGTLALRTFAREGQQPDSTDRPVP